MENYLELLSQAGKLEFYVNNLFTNLLKQFLLNQTIRD